MNTRAPMCISMLDCMHAYASCKEDLKIFSGTIGEFIAKTSGFVIAMFTLRLLQMALIPDILELVLVGLITAAYCYSIRSYLQTLVKSVSGFGFKGMFGMSGVLFGLLMLIMIV